MKKTQFTYAVCIDYFIESQAAVIFAYVVDNSVFYYANRTFQNFGFGYDFSILN